MTKGSEQQTTPDLIAAALTDAGMSALSANYLFRTDAEYFACSDALPSNDRAGIEMLRFYGKLRLALGQGCRVVLLVEEFSDAPRHILQAPISWLHLRRRAMNCLQHAHVRTLGDIVRKGTSGLLSLPNCGHSSVHNIVLALREYVLDSLDPREWPSWAPWSAVDEVQSMTTESAVEVRQPEFLSRRGLAGEVERLLHALTERDRRIIEGRLGLCGEVLTLEQMGARVGLTRERVRQIEKRAYQEFAAEDTWPQELRAVLDRLLTSRTDPLWVALLPSLDSYFEGWPWGDQCLARLVNEFGSSRFNCFAIEGAFVCSRAREQDFTAQRQLFHSLAKDLVSQRPTRFDLEVLAESLALNCNGRELHSELFLSARPYLQFARLPESQESVLVAFGRGIDHVVAAVLEESEEPLHYSEIHRRTVTRLETSVELRRVHGALTQAGVHLFGRGMYGLRRHLSASEDEVADILEEAEEILLSGDPDRQWHAQEIVEALPFQASLRGVEMNSYKLNIILSKSLRLRYLGRMVWVPQSSAHRDSGDRIDIAQACTRILREAGRPLTRREIMDLLKDWRGLGRHFQLHGRSDLIALAPGVWGLRGRDLPLTESEVASLLDALHRCLLERSKGLHQTEVLGALNRCNLRFIHAVEAYWVFSIAGADNRFRLSHGGYVGLAEWGDSRRISILQAAKRMARLSGSASRIEDLKRQMAELVEREVSIADAASALREAGFVVDGSTNTWMVSIDDALDEGESTSGSE